jgi:hypothetical protein
MAQRFSLIGVAFELEELSIIWRWAAFHGWIAPIHWDHATYEEIAGVSLKWDGSTDFFIWKCARTGDTVVENRVGIEIARGQLEDVLNVVASAAL